MKGKERKRGSAAELAELLCITERRVNQLVNKKIITREAEGNFILSEAISEYYAYKYASDEEIEYMEEKAKHEKAKRQLAELELKVKNNEYHAAADVEMVMTDMLTNLRSQLLGIPAKMAPQLANREKDYIDRRLAEEIHARLTELSEYKPDIFTR